MQADSAALGRAGYGLAAVSYDSAGVLAEFAKRKGITFPLLSDHDSKVIRSYQVADPQYQKGAQLDVTNERVYTNSIGYVPVFGMAMPAVFVIGTDGRVVWRFVSEGSELRLTGTEVLRRSVGMVVDGARRNAASSRRSVVATTASNAAVGLGNILRIGVELQVPEGFHVYAPDVGGGYRGVKWTMKAQSCFVVQEAAYPAAERKLLEATKETLPVYEGKLRLERPVILKPAIRAADASVYQAFLDVCVDGAKQVHLEGEFEFQACDATRCYAPEKVPLQWSFPFVAPDRQRVSTDLWREFEP